MNDRFSELYSVIIVDDESTIRQGMRKCVNWEELGFHIAGEAADGFEALSLAEKLHPDVVLTDIRMNNMDGMELIECLYSDYPDIKVILISGYSELEYYKKALELKIFDYLLKPTRIDTIKKAFQKLKISLDEEREREDLLASMQNRLDSSIPLARTWFLNELANGAEVDDDTITRARHIGIGLPEGKFRIIAISDRGGNSRKEDIAGMLEDRHLVPISFEDCIVFFSSELDRNVISSWFDPSFLLSSSVSVSSVGEGLFSIGKCLNEILITMNECLFKENAQSIIFYEDIDDIWAHPENIYDYDVSGMIKAVENGEIEETRRSVSRLFTEIRNNPIPYGYLTCLVSRVYYGISKVAWKQAVEIPRYKAFRISFDSAQTLDDKMEIFLEVLLEVAESQALTGACGRHSIVSEIDRIIEEDYMQISMSLTYIAEKIERSEAYISNLYKTEKDQNILERITDLRMSKAREFLSETNSKIYEIARSVGYTDASYFCKLFRKHEGISPAEWRRTH